MPGVEAGRLRELIHEVNGNRFDHSCPTEGNPRDVQAFTRILCDACSKLEATGELSARSLELQIWWRDHKESDARHARQLADDLERRRIVTAAMAKLTPEEVEALTIEVRRHGVGHLRGGQ